MFDFFFVNNIIGQDAFSLKRYSAIIYQRNFFAYRQDELSFRSLFIIFEGLHGDLLGIPQSVNFFTRFFFFLS